MAGKTIIIYYSHSGNTEKVACMIHKANGGTLCTIEPEYPYPKEYNAVLERSKKEIQTGFRPPLQTKVESLESYDTVFVGSPNWYNTIAPPVATFLAENNLSGKTVVPFYTHGGGGVGNIERDIAKLCPQSKMLPGLSIYGSDVNDAKIAAWLQKTGGCL